MADERINAFATTAASPASDDYVALDGTTNGTRKWAATHLQNLGTADSPTFATLTATTQLIGKGTATNDSASAGYIGEYISSSVAAASAVPAVLNTGVNITSISLTAGDWDAGGIVYYLPDGSTAWDLFLASCSTTSATQASRDTGGQGILKVSSGFGTGIASSLQAPLTRLSLTGTTTVYLVGTISFSSGSPTMYGTIRARRVR